MYLLMRDRDDGTVGAGAVAWDGGQWTGQQSRALRMDTPRAWRDYCERVGIGGDVWEAELVVHRHIERIC